jgi:hypothetical protein
MARLQTEAPTWEGAHNHLFYTPEVEILSMGTITEVNTASNNLKTNGIFRCRF